MNASSHCQPVNIDAKSIYGLMKTARELENADFPVDVDRMWGNCFPVLHQGDAKISQDMTVSQIPPRIELKSTFKELKELKHLLSTLSCLTSSLERKISPVEANCNSMVLSHGIKSVPVDVLDSIFEMVCCEDIRMAYNLSLVNKQVHDIVIRNPRLWNKIGNLYYDKTSLGQVRTSLRLSKDVGLNVELDLDITSTWYLPNLTNLTVRNLFPRPFLRLTPPLTTLILDIKEWNDDDAIERVYDMNLLLEFLRSSPLLETFCLRLDSFAPSTKDDDHTLPETVLPNLLTFDFAAQYLTMQSLLPFTRALCLPNLRNVHVDITAEIGGDDWLDCILPLSYEQYMNVEVLSYKTRTSQTIDDSAFTYRVPFKKLQNLRRITLETPNLSPILCIFFHDGQPCIMNFPKLEDIRFVQCDVLDGMELRFFRKLLGEQDRWDTLKEVTFKGCKSLSEGTVRSLFEGKDVTWEE